MYTTTAERAERLFSFIAEMKIIKVFTTAVSSAARFILLFCFFLIEFRPKVVRGVYMYCMYVYLLNKSRASPGETCTSVEYQIVTDSIQYTTV